MFDAANITKNSDKCKYVYSCYGIVFDGLGYWSSGNDFARNVIIFGIANSLSSHTDNQNNDFLVLGGGPTDDINGSKKSSNNFSKAKTKFCLTLH